LCEAEQVSVDWIFVSSCDTECW